MRNFGTGSSSSDNSSDLPKRTSMSIEHECSFEEISLDNSPKLETSVDNSNDENYSKMVNTESFKPAIQQKNSISIKDKIISSLDTIKGANIFAKSKNKQKYESEMIAEFLSNNFNSTSALIMNDRPENAPPKTKEEIEKHLKLSEQLLESAKREILSEVKKKMDENEKKKRREDYINEYTRIWKTEILPNWNSVKDSRKVCKLWAAGIPPSIRSVVWKISIGNDLCITRSFLEIMINEANKAIEEYDEERTHNHPESGYTESTQSVYNPNQIIFLVDMDIERTYNNLKIFQKGGPYYTELRSLLVAYCCFRKDVGYVQGMSFLMGAILLNMNADDTFIVFTNLMNRPLQLALFTLRDDLLNCLYFQFSLLLETRLPTIFLHFQANQVSPNIYLIEWLFTMYTRVLPLDISIRIMDIYFRDKEEFLFRTALGLMKYYEKEILSMEGFGINTLLTSFQSTIDEDLLFKNIFSIPQSNKWCEELQNIQLKLLGIETKNS